MTSEENKTYTNLAIENLNLQVNESYRCAKKLMSLRNFDLDKLNTVFDKIYQEHKILIDSMIDNCIDSTHIAAVTHNKFEFDTSRKEWFLKIRGSFCDDANLPSSSKPRPDLLSSKAPSECSRASNSSSKSFNVFSTSLRISMKRLRACEKLKLAQPEAAQLKEEAQNELKQKIWQEENELKQRIRQKEARRKIELANAQYEIWKDLDVQAEPDLEVKPRDPLGGSQSKKEPFLQAKPFSPAISHVFPSSSSQLIKSGAECKADIIRAPRKVSISTLSVYNLTTLRQQKDKEELGECFFGQSLKSEARTTVSLAQLPSTSPRDNVTMISEAQSEVK